MKITLCLADNNEHLKYFKAFAAEENLNQICYKNVFGYCMDIECSTSLLEKMCREISVFALEFYLREAVFNKIYDEYVSLDITDAGMLFSMLSKNISDTILYGKLIDLFDKSIKICIDSFIIFNLKPIMQDIYKKVDCYAEQILVRKEKEAFEMLIKTYSELGFDSLPKAMSEFSSDDI